MNKLIISGFIGKDAELTTFDNGQVAKFSLATNEIYKNKAGEKVESTEWFNVECFGKVAEIAQKYFKKGTQLLVEGKIKTDKWTDKNSENRYSTKVVMQNFEFIGGAKSEDTQKPQPKPLAEMPEDDLPF